MNNTLITTGVLLAILAAIGGIQLALTINVYEPYPDVQHVPIITPPRQPETLTSEAATSINTANMQSLT